MFYDNGWAFGFNNENMEIQGYIPINHVEILET